MTGGLVGAPLTAVAAAQVTLVESDVLLCERSYEAARRAPAFWGMIDLRGSASFRIAAGDRSAYVRSEVFSRAVRRLLPAQAGVEVLKELGDAVLTRSDGLRPLLEMACLIDMVGRAWASAREGHGVTLAARTAVTYGVGVRLERDGTTDYVGAALDRLARVAGVTQDGDGVMVLDEVAWSQDGRLLMEYPYLRADGPRLLPAQLLKAGEPPVRYRSIRADRQAMAGARDNFVPYRE